VTLEIKVAIQPLVNLNSEEIRLVVGQPLMVLASLRNGIGQRPVKINAPEGLEARYESGRGRFFKIHLLWNGPPPDGPVTFEMEIGSDVQTVEVEVVGE
jgi:hypothetical protein